MAFPVQFGSSVAIRKKPSLYTVLCPVCIFRINVHC
jgi:hypothetical protein